MLIDYFRSDVPDSYHVFRELPLAFDSLKMDVQYFKYESNDQSSCDFANQIKAYVSGQVSHIGNSASLSASAAASSQVQRQVNANSLEGTLIVSCTCTHEQARMLSPLKLDVEKLISAWNQVNEKSPINMPGDANDIEAEGQKTGATDVSRALPAFRPLHYEHNTSNRPPPPPPLYIASSYRCTIATCYVCVAACLAANTQAADRCDDGLVVHRHGPHPQERVELIKPGHRHHRAEGIGRVQEGTVFLQQIRRLRCGPVLLRVHQEPV